jgi:transcriptional regulator with XRE-family HTH domain
MPRHFDGSRLRQARKANRLSDAELAIALGKSVQLVHLVEANHRVPSVKVLDEWCQLLGVPLDFCFVSDDTQVSA